MKTFELDANHDIQITNYSPVFKSNQDYIEEKLKTKFRLFKGEYFLDITKGVPYYQYILKKNPDIRQVKNIFKEQALQIEDVLEVINLDLEFDEAGRILTITFDLNTTFGTISGTV